MIEDIDTVARRVLRFWFEETPAARRFGRDAGFDAEIARRFGALQAALSAELSPGWSATPQRLLAAVIVLDQFSRNLHRSTGAAFANDAAARALTRLAVTRGDEAALTITERQFLYMPLMHSENAADQAQSVALFFELGGEARAFAEAHRDVIAAFGRFPGRNAALGRTSTAGEAAWLASDTARF